MLNIAEAEKNTLAEDYQRLKLADAWTRNTPKKAPASIGAPAARTPTRARTGGKGLGYAPPQSNEDILLKKKVESDRQVKDLTKQLKELKKVNKQLQKDVTSAKSGSGQQSEAVAHAKASQSKMESLARRQQTSIKSLEKDLASTQSKLRDTEHQLAESRSALVKASNEVRLPFQSPAARAPLLSAHLLVPVCKPSSHAVLRFRRPSRRGSRRRERPSRGRRPEKTPTPRRLMMRLSRKPSVLRSSSPRRCAS